MKLSDLLARVHAVSCGPDFQPASNLLRLETNKWISEA